MNRSVINIALLVIGIAMTFTSVLLENMFNRFILMMLTISLLLCVVSIYLKSSSSILYILLMLRAIPEPLNIDPITFVRTTMLILMFIATAVAITVFVMIGIIVLKIKHMRGGTNAR